METNQKYIVYLTTNTVNGKIYIGVHKIDTPDQFDGYLGCGAYVNNPKSYELAKCPLQQDVKAYGVKNFKRVTLLKDSLINCVTLANLLVTYRFISRVDTYNMCPIEYIDAFEYDIKEHIKKVQVLREHLEYGLGNVSSIQAKSFSIAKFKQQQARKVFKYDSDGNFLEAYSTQLEAEKAHKGCNISKAIRLKKQDELGNYWMLCKVPNIQKIGSKSARKVGKYSESGELVETFNSATAAAKADGSAVWHVLSGRNETQKGYKYKYLND